MKAEMSPAAILRDGANAPPQDEVQRVWLPCHRASVFNHPFTNWKRPADTVAFTCLGGRGFSMASNAVARRCAMFFFALSVCVAGARYITEAHAAGAIAVGKCGAYGQAFDYGAEHEARTAAQK